MSTTFEGVQYPTARARDAAIVAQWATGDGSNTIREATRWIGWASIAGYEAQAEIEAAWGVVIGDFRRAVHDAARALVDIL